MTDEVDPAGGDEARGFGPIDPELGAWLASAPSPRMPDQVWARLEAALAAEPPMNTAAEPPMNTAAEPPMNTAAEPPVGTAAVVDLGQARQRKSVAARTWPLLGAAAGVVLIGVIALPVIRGGNSPEPVSAGGAASVSETVERRSEAPSETTAPVLTAPNPSPSTPGATPRTSVAESAPVTASAPAPATVMPAALKATGTNYTPAQINEQARALLASAGFDQPVDVVQFDPSTAPLPDPLGDGGFTASAEQLVDCLQRLGVDEQTMPLVVDRATYDGHDAGVVVLAHATGADPALDVVVVEAACTDDDIANAMHYALALAN